MRSVVSLRFCSALAVLALLVLACAREPGPPQLDETSRRSLPAGEVVGYTGEYGSHVWQGLPYAEPPVGELRWRAPSPAAPWQGTRETLSTGEACPQFASVFAGEGRGATGVIGSEDCLYVDVYAPRFDRGDVPKGEARLPVLFWIHGGGNSIGRAGFYDGGNLAATHQVVVVALNYRLGPFGWFRHASLRGDDATPLDRSGNYGTLDLVAALDWVQRNVAAFGGDPQNVTIFGESAGGRNVLSLLVSDRAGGLFHRALVQSGGAGSASLEEAEAFEETGGAGHSSNEILAILLERDGSLADRAEARAWLAERDDAEVAAYLRSKTQTEILAAYVDETDSFEGMIWVPQVFPDGVSLPTQATNDLLAAGAYHQVPLIFGTNRDENKLFMGFDQEFAFWRLGLFPTARDPERFDAHSDALARAWKARSVDGLARLATAAQGPSVYAYRWDWDEEPSLPFLYDGSKMLGAAHGLEIAFFFGHFDFGPDTRLIFGGGSREGREALAGQMMSYLAEFAYTGSPGRGRDGSLPEWQGWDESSADAPKYVVFDTPQDGGVRMSSDTYTIERVLAEVVDDQRFASARDRCATLHTLVQSEYATAEQYADAGGSVCLDYALDDYPWVDVAARE